MQTRQSFATDAARFAAVAGRDRHADPFFVYAVKSTGIYCKPSCSARTPLAKNVEYFREVANAERAGYRACKRCRPQEPEATHPSTALVRRACELLTQSDEIVSLQELAAELKVSKYHLHRVFKHAMGMTPAEYGASQRLTRVTQALAKGSSVTRAIYAAGYSSTSRFYKDSPALGMSASHRRQAGAGELIRFKLVQSSLGNTLIGATERGLCWVAFGDDPKQLQQELFQRFARAEFQAADPRLERLSQRVVKLIDNGKPTEAVPLDLLGTSFQLRVWRALLQTKRGQTTTYGELASQLESPHAARAIGTACGDNPVAVIVPCHRVIRKDGSLGGYRWGLDRKQKLLERERD